MCCQPLISANEVMDDISSIYNDWADVDSTLVYNNKDLYWHSHGHTYLFQKMGDPVSLLPVFIEPLVINLLLSFVGGKMLPGVGDQLLSALSKVMGWRKYSETEHTSVPLMKLPPVISRRLLIQYDKVLSGWVIYPVPVNPLTVNHFKSLSPDIKALYQLWKTLRELGVSELKLRSAQTGAEPQVTVETDQLPAVTVTLTECLLPLESYLAREKPRIFWLAAYGLSRSWLYEQDKHAGAFSCTYLESAFLERFTKALECVALDRCRDHTLIFENGSYQYSHAPIEKPDNESNSRILAGKYLSALSLGAHSGWLARLRDPDGWFEPGSDVLVYQPGWKTPEYILDELDNYGYAWALRQSPDFTIIPFDIGRQLISGILSFGYRLWSSGILDVTQPVLTEEELSKALVPLDIEAQGDWELRSPLAKNWQSLKADRTTEYFSSPVVIHKAINPLIAPEAAGTALASTDKELVPASSQALKNWLRISPLASAFQIAVGPDWINRRLQESVPVRTLGNGNGDGDGERGSSASSPSPGSPSGQSSSPSGSPGSLSDKESSGGAPPDEAPSDDDNRDDPGCRGSTSDTELSGVSISRKRKSESPQPVAIKTMRYDAPLTDSDAEASILADFTAAPSAEEAKARKVLTDGALGEPLYPMAWHKNAAACHLDAHNFLCLQRTDSAQCDLTSAQSKLKTWLSLWFDYHPIPKSKKGTGVILTEGENDLLVRIPTTRYIDPEILPPASLAYIAVIERELESHIEVYELKSGCFEPFNSFKRKRKPLRKYFQVNAVAEVNIAFRQILPSESYEYSLLLSTDELNSVQSAIANHDEDIPAMVALKRRLRQLNQGVESQDLSLPQELADIPALSQSALVSADIGGHCSSIAGRCINPLNRAMISDGYTKIPVSADRDSYFQAIATGLNIYAVISGEPPEWIAKRVREKVADFLLNITAIDKPSYYSLVPKPPRWMIYPDKIAECIIPESYDEGVFSLQDRNRGGNHLNFAVQLQFELTIIVHSFESMHTTKNFRDISAFKTIQTRIDPLEQDLAEKNLPVLDLSVDHRNHYSIWLSRELYQQLLSADITDNEAAQSCLQNLNIPHSGLSDNVRFVVSLPAAGAVSGEQLAEEEALIQAETGNDVSLVEIEVPAQGLLEEIAVRESMKSDLLDLLTSLKEMNDRSSQKGGEGGSEIEPSMLTEATEKAQRFGESFNKILQNLDDLQLTDQDVIWQTTPQTVYKEAELQKLKKKLLDQEKNLEAAEEKIIQLSRQLSASNQDEQNTQARISDLTKKNNDLLYEHTQKLDTIRNRNDEISRLAHNLRQQNAVAETLERDKQAATEQLANLLSNHVEQQSQVEEALSSLESLIEALNPQFSSEETVARMSSNPVQTSEDISEPSAAEMPDSIEKLEALEPNNEPERLQHDADTLPLKDKVECQMASSKVPQRLHIPETWVERFAQAMKRMQIQNRESSDKESQLSTKLSEKTGELETMRASKAVVESELEMRSKTVSNLNARLQQLEARFTISGNQANSLLEKLQRSTDMNARQAHEYQDLNALLSEKTKELEHLQDQFKQSQQHSDDKVQAHVVKITALQGQLTELQNRCEGQEECILRHQTNEDVLISWLPFFENLVNTQQAELGIRNPSNALSEGGVVARAQAIRGKMQIVHARIREIKPEIKNLIAGFLQRWRELVRSRSEIHQLRASALATERRLRTAEQSRSNWETTAREATAAVGVEKSKVRELQELTQKQEEVLVQLKGVTGQIAQQSLSLLHTFSQIIEINNKLRSDMQEKTTEHNRETNEFQKIQTSLESTRDFLLQELGITQEALKTSEAQLSERDTEKAELTHQLEQLNQGLVRLLGNPDTPQETLSESHRESTAHEQSADRQLAKVIRQAKTLNREKSTAEEKRLEAEQQLSERTKQLDARNNQLRLANLEVERSEKALQLEKSSARQEVETLSLTLVEKEKELTSEQALRKALQARIEKLRSQLNQSDRLLSERDEQVEISEEYAARLERKICSLEKDNQNMIRRLEVAAAMPSGEFESNINTAFDESESEDIAIDFLSEKLSGSEEISPYLGSPTMTSQVVQDVSKVLPLNPKSKTAQRQDEQGTEKPRRKRNRTIPGDSGEIRQRKSRRLMVMNSPSASTPHIPREAQGVNRGRSDISTTKLRRQPQKRPARGVPPLRKNLRLIEPEEMTIFAPAEERHESEQEGPVSSEGMTSLELSDLVEMGKNGPVNEAYEKAIATYAMTRKFKALVVQSFKLKKQELALPVYPGGAIAEGNQWLSGHINYLAWKYRGSINDQERQTDYEDSETKVKNMLKLLKPEHDDYETILKQLLRKNLNITPSSDIVYDRKMAYKIRLEALKLRKSGVSLVPSMMKAGLAYKQWNTDAVRWLLGKDQINLNFQNGVKGLAVGQAARIAELNPGTPTYNQALYRLLKKNSFNVERFAMTHHARTKDHSKQRIRLPAIKGMNFPRDALSKAALMLWLSIYRKGFMDLNHTAVNGRTINDALKMIKTPSDQKDIYAQLLTLKWHHAFRAKKPKFTSPEQNLQNHLRIAKIKPASWLGEFSLPNIRRFKQVLPPVEFRTATLKADGSLKEKTIRTPQKNLPDLEADIDEDSD